MEKISDYFGSLVFDDRAMKERLSGDVYAAFKKAVADSSPIDITVANAMADAMRNWAIEHGATHYSHWFQPMTGITAEKHDSFISPASDGGVIMKFSGSELIKGEPDASSFPSGGLRTTFEARGYTDWDPTSFAFIKGHTLCIPTAFCSYTGDALDTKTPLLRSMEAINKEALRVLRLFGNTTAKKVTTSVGPEQEYFIINRDQYLKRPDLIFTGRTLFGAKPSKGQELNDHYFGSIKPKISSFMEDLNTELWKLGILAKTEHNEVAPAQHELAPIYSTTNIATDHNQLTMEVMQTVAYNHNLVCLLHEKPFAGVNGSGKHNNWSLSTDEGVNLLSPGETPYDNAQFLVFLVAVIKAIDEYQGLLRYSVASAANDHRLGANEAPPAVVSIFLGDELTAVLSAIEKDEPYQSSGKTFMNLGVDILPDFPKDNTDRNRTSPFAFTGNKFEFRMLGSSNSIADCNIVINTIVAEALKQFADELEGATDFKASLHKLIKRTYIEHKRIIFNGNGYDDAWIKEATEQRGLLNLRTTPDCVSVLDDAKNRDVLISHNVLSAREIDSRKEIMLENYIKTINIECSTMTSMAKTMYIPAIENYMGKLSNIAINKQKLSIDYTLESTLLSKLTSIVEQIYQKDEALEAALMNVSTASDMTAQGEYITKHILPLMAELRTVVDEGETLTAKEFWPVPSYGELLFEI